MNKRHLIIMLLCCLIPVAALAALYVFRVEITPTLWAGMMLLCPVLHLLMMKFIPHGGEHEHHHTESLLPKSHKPKLKE